MRSRLLLFSAIIFAISAVTAISFAQRSRDTADKPITGDFKITIKNTSSGQTSQSTSLIKGKRERSETSMGTGGANSVSITQCDMRRTLQVNDSTRKYMIAPMDSDDDGASAGNTSGQARTEPSRRGGVVTMNINTVDTGERKEMFGFTARHLKRTMTSETSPDACDQNKIRMDTDGWYINLEYGMNCGFEQACQHGPTLLGRLPRSLRCQEHGPEQPRFPAGRNHDDVRRERPGHVLANAGSNRHFAAAARRGIVRRAGRLHRGKEPAGIVGRAVDGRRHGDATATVG